MGKGVIKIKTDVLYGGVMYMGKEFNPVTGFYQTRKRRRRYSYFSKIIENFKGIRYTLEEKDNYTIFKYEV